MQAFVSIGTRPEIIKMTPVVQELEKRSHTVYLLHTGQHYSEFMNDVFFKSLNLREPDTNLKVGSGSHAEQTAKALIGIEHYLEEVKPDVSLVQGDTNTVLSAALASVKLQIPVGHVEAGLRSFDTRMPEEHNRRITDHISKFLFAPTKVAAKRLKEESVWGKIFVTGNTVIDILERMVPIALKRPNPIAHLNLDRFALMTLHRSENVDNEQVLKEILDGISSLGMDIVFAAHPRTIQRLSKFNILDKLKNESWMHLIQPPEYLDFINLIHQCDFVLTDSGGIQEEVTSPSLNKRVFVLRKTTERPEAVDAGYAIVVGVTSKGISQKIKKTLNTQWKPLKRNPYGRGDASKKIVDILEDEYS